MASNSNYSNFLTVADEDSLHDHNQLAAIPPNAIWSYAPSSVKTEEVQDEENWAFMFDDATRASSHSMDQDDLVVLPGGLSQISMTPSSSSRSTSPDIHLPGSFDYNGCDASHLRALSPLVVNRLSKPLKKGAVVSSPADSPHPYSISPANTTALFTRASSVAAANIGSKKSRAPPSGPISTKDFIPPDVSGLSKREARLVKNRAAAFLSRQRKREEFEGLETRVEALEADNARLYRELESYRNGGPIETTSSDASQSAALAAELAGLKRQLAARDQELSKIHTRLRSLVGVQEQLAAEHERAAEREKEIAELRKRAESAAQYAKREDESEDSDSDDAQSTVVGSAKKEVKGAGSMAFMVLLFSLSTLLTNASSQQGSAVPPKPAVPSPRVGRMGHRRSDSQQLASVMFPDAYDPFSSAALDSLMLNTPSFGFDEDALLGASATTSFATPSMATGGLSAASAFAGLAANTAQGQQNAAQAQSLEQAAAAAISGVKSLGPDQFEFDFTVPSSAGTSSPSKKIKVCVKSALPLNLDVAAFGQNTETPTVLKAAEGFKFGSTVPNPFEFKPDDDLDVSPFSSSASSWSPTLSSTSSSESSRKRKRVTVEINPQSSKRRASELDIESWDVRFSEDDEYADNDVHMRF